MISSSSKYAIRAIIYLANKKDNEHNIGIKQIATDLKIPTPFLSKILQTLAKHKVLNSTKGPNGGFCLSRDANHIKLIEVIAAIEGEDVNKPCLFGLDYCSTSDGICPLHSKFTKICSNMKEIFEHETIGDLSKNVIKKEKKKFKK